MEVEMKVDWSEKDLESIGFGEQLDLEGKREIERLISMPSIKIETFLLSHSFTCCALHA